MRGNDEQNTLMTISYAESLNDLSRLIIREKIDIRKLDIVEVFRIFQTKINSDSVSKAAKYSLTRALSALFKTVQIKLEQNFAILLHILSNQISSIAKMEMQKQISRSNLIIVLENYLTCLLDTLIKA